MLRCPYGRQQQLRVLGFDARGLHQHRDRQQQGIAQSQRIVCAESRYRLAALEFAVVATSHGPRCSDSVEHCNTQGLVIDQMGIELCSRCDPRQSGWRVEDALSEFDAQYSSFLSYNTTDRQRNASNIFTPSIFTARDTTYQNAISKRLATGGVATARSQTIYSPTTSRPLAVPLAWFRATTRRFLKFKSNIHWPKVEVHWSIGFLSSWLASTKTSPSIKLRKVFEISCDR